MRDVVLSEQARRSIASLAPSRAEELDRIIDHIDEFLPALERAGYVIEYHWYGLRCLRYADHKFPYIILFSVSDTQPVIAVEMILSAAI